MASLSVATVALAATVAQSSVFSFGTFLTALTKGTALGCIYAIIGLGFVLIFKGTQTLNFAQGALAAVGALFLSFLVADQNIPLTWLPNPLGDLGSTWATWMVNLIIALMFGAVLGLVVERLAIRPMVGEPLFSMAVITLGVEIVLRTLANDSFEVLARPINSPWGTSGFELADVFVNYSYIAIYVAAALSFIGVALFFKTRLGVAMRAVAFDQEASMAQGINVGRIFALAWALGAGLAALGGILSTQPPIQQAGAVVISTPLVAFRALPAIVLGGLDSVKGALIGGIAIGCAEVFAGQYLPLLIDDWQSVLGPGFQEIVPYIVMLGILLFRPYGLYGTEEIRRV
jgi:branched-chain amino acid transport system permease protein